MSKRKDFSRIKQPGMRLLIFVLFLWLILTAGLGRTPIYAEEEMPPYPEPGFITDEGPAISIYDDNYQPRFYAPLGANPPAKYDSRDLGRVTPVKNQGITGLCWSFATISSIESSLLAHGQVANPAALDLSERQFAYFVYHKGDDPLDNIDNDWTEPAGTSFGDDAGDDNYLFCGCDTYIVRWSLAQWKGLTNERINNNSKLTFQYMMDQYPEDQYIDNRTIMNKFYKATALHPTLAQSANEWHVTGAYSIAMKDKDDVKKAIMDNGAVTAAMYMTLGTTQSWINSAYYNWRIASTNHLISIVGWDDNYPKENFGGSGQEMPNPKGNGAWLCKNSYGIGGDHVSANTGYFWMSYEDVALTRETAKAYTYVLKPAKDHDNMYQYDGGTSWWYRGIPSGGSIANIYEVKGNPGKGEELRSVGMHFTYDVNVDYSIQIYTNIQKASDPTSGTAMLKTPLKGSTTYAGFYTVDLLNPVLLEEGSKYSIVITVSHKDKSDVKCDIDLTEQDDPYDPSYIWHTTEAPNQCFGKNPGDTTWRDYYYSRNPEERGRTSNRIKGMTKNIDVTTVSAPTGKTLTYNGKVQTGVAAGKNYTIKTNTGTNAKTYTATVSLKDKSKSVWTDGTTADKNISWKINPANISGATVTGVSDKEYTGNAITQTPTVKMTLGGVTMTLVAGTDYTVSYKNNKDIGKATVTITGKGNFTGTKTLQFNIRITPSLTRIWGSNRFKTSFHIASEYRTLTKGKNKLDSIIVAQSADAPDALSGGFLSKSVKAPIIVWSAGMNKIVQDYIKANVKAGGTVYLLGSEAVVGNQIKNGMSAYSFKRLAGTNRYKTNVAILNAAGFSKNLTNQEVLVCDGNTFGSALIASGSGRPVMLVTKGALVTNSPGKHDGQIEWLQKNKGKISKFYILGDTSLVDAKVENLLKSYGKVERISAKTMDELSAKVASKFRGSATEVFVASSVDFPDGLCGGPLAIYKEGPILLVKNNQYTQCQKYTEGLKYLKGLTVFGNYAGDTAVFDATCKKLAKNSTAKWTKKERTEY